MSDSNPYHHHHHNIEEGRLQPPLYTEYIHKDTGEVHRGRFKIGPHRSSTLSCPSGGGLEGAAGGREETSRDGVSVEKYARGQLQYENCR